MAPRHPTKVGWRGSAGPNAGSRLADGQNSGYLVPGAGGRLADGQISSDPTSPSGQRGEARADVSQPANSGGESARGSHWRWRELTRAFIGDCEDDGEPTRASIGVGPPKLLLPKAVVEMRP